MRGLFPIPAQGIPTLKSCSMGLNLRITIKLQTFTF